MRRWVGVVSGWVFAAGVPTQAAGQQCEVSVVRDAIDAQRTVVDRYAPVYWFSPGERYFPTLPVFTAFDGVDNDADGSLDFADPDEIAPVDGRRRLSWEGVIDPYDGGYDKLARTAVFYRVRDLNRGHVHGLWRYLKSDEQRWKRLDIDGTTLRTLQSDTTQFQVVEYYVYYLNDFGLIGHQWDIELVFVFLPKDPDLAERFRVLVGGGHTQRVPSNVLVVSGFQAAELSGPNARLGVLVELGDHSSAIDVNPFGRFQPGLDANWHDHDIWGTRDVQASSGRGAIGPYDLWMTFPREASSRIFPPEAVLATAQIPQIRGIISGRNQPKYSLLPVDLFRCLFEAADEDDRATIEAWIDLLADQPWSWEFTGWRDLSDSQKDAAVTAMRRWSEATPQAKRRIWESPHYRSPPTRIFKQQLFRPVLRAMSVRDIPDIVNVWATLRSNRALLVEAGFEVPAFWLPIRLPGYLELHGGVYTRCGNVFTDCGDGRSLALSAVHTGHYNRAFTWYGQLSYVPRRAEVTGDPSLADMTMGGGLTLVPASLNAQPPFSWFRIRVGLATGVTFAGPRLDKTRWELQLAFLRGSSPIP